MDASQLLARIALLIDLAQKGEIDPWDVQVIEVIDLYLNEMAPMLETTPANYAADLSQSGQAFLSASMLVLYKANTLVAQSVASPTSEDGQLEVAVVEPRVRLPLEQQLCRRPAALPPQKRPVTLPELITQLQLMAAQLQQAQTTVATIRRSRSNHASHSRAQALRALELAHQENLTEVAKELEEFLARSHHLPHAQDWLNLDTLVACWKQQTYDGAIAHMTPLQTHDRVSVFWALLLLSAQSKVELSQDGFYQEIKIRPLLSQQ